MFLLDVVCEDYFLSYVITILRRVITVIQIIAPIIALVSLVVTFTKLVINPEEKKYRGIIKNTIIALVIVFLIPNIVNIVMDMTDDKFEFSACWMNAPINMNDGIVVDNSSDSDTAKSITNGESIKTNDSSSNSSDETEPISKDKTYKIMFVGNSKTYRSTENQRITVIFKKMAKNGGYKTKVTKVTASGMHLNWHANNSESSLRKNVDIAVLQEGTGVYEQENIVTFLTGAKAVSKLIRSKNSNVKIYLRQIWGHKDNLNTSVQTRSYNHAETVAREINATIIPDGKAFDKAISDGIKCYSDNTHQSKYGAYLSAACIYKKVFGANPENLTYKGYISEKRAKKLRKIANTVC